LVLSRRPAEPQISSIEVHVKFITELRERRLVQIALSYAGASWIALEVVNQMVERSIVPELVYKVVLIWAVLGFGAALLIGWHHGEKGKQKAPVSEWVLLSVLALLAVGFSGSTVSSHFTDAQLAASAENTLDMRRVAVLYFEDATGGDQQYLADALTEDLIAELSQVPILSVVSSNGTRQFRDSPLTPDSIGKLLLAGTVVEGRLDLRRENARIAIALVDAQSGATIQRTTLERPLDDPLALRASVVEETSRLLRTWIGSEVRLRQSALATSSPRAWLLAQRAEKLRKDGEDLLRQQNDAQALEAFQQADAMLMEAERLDAVWADPPALRAVIAYRLARLESGDPAAALSRVAAGLPHAEEALRRDRTHARALEMRGSLSYLKWLLRVEQDPRAQDALVSSARSDLELATRYDRLLASAHATLSHLYGRTESLPEMMVAANRALEADAYLENLDVIIWRMYNVAEGLQQFTEARRWCERGVDQFPDNYRFVNCSLRLMYLPGSTPDIAAAWDLLDRLKQLVPQADLEFEGVRGEVIMAAILGRAGLPDSARSVLQRASARITEQLDPHEELLAQRAYATLLTGDHDGAVALLARAAAANPGTFGSGQSSWFWRDLESHPRYRRLVGLD
jgi:eukaryotic-like serine/threonine-protein kinase